MKRNLRLTVEHDAIVLEKPSGSAFSFSVYSTVQGNVARLIRKAFKEQLEELIDWLDEEDPDWSRLFSNLSPLVGPAHAQAPEKEDLVYTHSVA